MINDPNVNRFHITRLPFDRSNITTEAPFEAYRNICPGGCCVIQQNARTCVSVGQLNESSTLTIEFPCLTI